MSQQLERDVEHRLLEHGVRFTSGRREVFAAVSSAAGPRTATELHSDLNGRVPLSSLYRSLAVLADSGVLDQHHGAEETRYELAEWLGEHHHHLVCTSCGTVDDVTASPEHEALVDRLVTTFAASSDFTVSGHRFEIEGLCSSCR